MNKLKLTNSDDLLKVSGIVHEHFEAEARPLSIEIKPWSDKRSLSQNALLWKWYGEICDQVKRKNGETHETEMMHEVFKDKFLPSKEYPISNTVKHIKSTKLLDKGEMHEFMNKIHQWASNAGFSLTIPEQSEYMKNERE